MKNEITERDVLQEALGMLQKKTGLAAIAEFEPKNYKDTPTPDARIQLILEDLEWNFAAEKNGGGAGACTGHIWTCPG